jgi:hypothetical protein
VPTCISLPPCYVRLSSNVSTCLCLRAVFCYKLSLLANVEGLPFGFPDPLKKGNVDGTGSSRVSSKNKHGVARNVGDSPTKNNKRASTFCGSEPDAKRASFFSGQKRGRSHFKRRK